MAPMLFSRAISAGEPIKVFNNGDMLRDFTYIDDIVDGTSRVVLGEPVDHGKVPFNVYNIGCSHPVRLMDFIKSLRNRLAVRLLKSFCQCSRGMFMRRMLIRQTWNEIMVTSLPLPYMKAWKNS